MATMENQSVDSDDIVTLVLGENRVEASREKLSRYSLYYASLFSENFKDHSQNEFAINYDISLATLKNFIHWINNEGEHTKVIYSSKYFFMVRASLEKFLTGHYTELLELLEFSIVFMTEKLTENIVEIIIRTRLTPPKVLDMWLLGENLGLKVLRDIAFAVCLDRFNELPDASLAELPVDNFYKLVLNVNLKSTSDRLLAVRDLWKTHNEVSTDTPDSFLKFLNSDPVDMERILKSKKQHRVRCVVGDKPNKSLGMYTWNGYTLREVATMTNELIHTKFDDNGLQISGWQVTGRDFSIYLIGGEQGLGTGRFNVVLWRYCLITKKWYTETLLPRPRRHMAVAFLGNKLYLFGGVGRHRVKLSSVDVFDVHTGLWSRAAEIPEQFTDVPVSHVLKGKFIYHASFFYVYDPQLDEWSTFEDHLSVHLGRRFPVTIHAFIGHDDADSLIYALYVFEDKWHVSSFIVDWEKHTVSLHGISEYGNYPPEQPLDDLAIINWPYHISFAHVTDSSTDKIELSIRKIPFQSVLKSKIQSGEGKNVLPNSFNHQLGSFNLIDPEHLHTLIMLSDKESINV